MGDVKECYYMGFSMVGDVIRIDTKNNRKIGNIVKCGRLYFLGIVAAGNDILFDLAGIENKREFQENVLGYSDDGDFPFCKTREDVIKLVKAIVDYNNSRLSCKTGFLLKKRKHITFNFNL